MVSGTSTFRTSPQRPDTGHLRGTDAEGKSAHSAVRRCVAVRSNHHVAGTHVAVFRQYLMADASPIAPHVMEFRNSLLRDKFPDLLLIGCRLAALGRNPMIEDHRDFRRDPIFWAATPSL